MVFTQLSANDDGASVSVGVVIAAVVLAVVGVGAFTALALTDHGAEGTTALTTCATIVATLIVLAKVNRVGAHVAAIRNGEMEEKVHAAVVSGFTEAMASRYGEYSPAEPGTDRRTQDKP